MNETIVKTEKLTELKNLVSEIEKLKTKNIQYTYQLKRIEYYEKQLYELIKNTII